MGALLSRRAFVAGLAAGVAGAGAAEAATPADLKRIHRVAIHPAIGIARVGNSDDAFFFGPEIPGGVPRGPFKDQAGAMAKQAARFRLYGYDAQGRVVAELTAREADITWSVAVANTKALWYGVDVAFDLPGAPAADRRNAAIADRATLAIVAAPRTLAGPGARPRPLDGGSFRGRPITLGEVMTDADGRLVVLGGAGGAYASDGAPPMSGYADNDGWADDTCDGPVDASVRIGDRVFQAEPAWVVSVGPNYAPAVASGLVSLHDVVDSALVGAGMRRAPATEFERHVWPVFERMADLQWVNEGFFQKYGFGSARDFSSVAWRARLADGSAGNAPLRAEMLALFRDPAFTRVEPDLEPQLYGDKVVLPPDAVEPRQWLALTPLQHRHLTAWAEGRFTRAPERPRNRLEDHALADQPAALDRAAMEASLGGPFHPGIEFPWIARVAWIWTPEMRLRSAVRTPDLTDYGAVLTAPRALSRSGPLSRLGPGGITQWMGLPWHADWSSCRSGYESAVSPILPAFWPARVPTTVLAEADYKVVMDTARSIEERRAAFARRRDWERFISAPTRPPVLAAMAQEWHRLGLVQDRPGPAEGPFPASMKVETLVGFAREPEVAYGANTLYPQIGTFPLAVANSDDNSLRLVAADGEVSQMRLTAPLERPEGMTRNLDGNLYVCCMNANVVRRVTPEGEVTPFAEGFSSPVGIAGDRTGNLYVANFVEKGFISVITPDGKSRVLVPPEAGLAFPIGIVVTPDGALLVSWGGASVARIDIATGKVIDLHWLTDFHNPRQMAYDTSYRLYVADQMNNAVRRFDLMGVPIPLILRGATLTMPFGLVFDVKGDLYASQTRGTLIKRVQLKGEVGMVSDFADGLPNPGGVVFIG